MFERITVNKTSLYQSHKKLQAKLIPFAGHEMPVSYGPISDEYKAIRKQCGIFDVSHMGQFRITGIHAEDFINVLTINNVEMKKWPVFNFIGPTEEILKYFQKYIVIPCHVTFIDPLLLCFQ